MGIGFDTVVPFVLVAIAGAALCRRFGIAAALPLVGLGLALSFLPGSEDAIPDPDVVLEFILPPLVFAAAQDSSLRDLKRFSRPILALAIVLVIVTTFAVGAVAAMVVPALPFALACALGAVLAPTDAVAATTAAKRAGLRRGLLTVLEGESLVNDATALTAFRVAAMAAAAGAVTFGQIVGSFSLAVLVGGAVGVGAGWGVGQIVRRVPDAVVTNAVVLLTPFLVYALAEHFEGSGFLAVVIAGVWIAHAATVSGRYDTRLRSAIVWTEVTFVLEAVAFVMVGVEFRQTVVRALDGQGARLVALILLITLVLVVVRGVFVLGSLPLMRARARRTGTLVATWRDAAIIAWAGARGPVSVLAVLGLPTTLPRGQRDIVLVTTFGVVVVTLVLSTTLGPLIKRLGMVGADETDVVRRAHAAMYRAGQSALDELLLQAEEEDTLSDASIDLLRSEQDALAEQARRRSRAAPDADEQATLREIRQGVLAAQRSELVRLRDEGDIADHLMRQLLGELDARESLLDRRR